ncbi:MAG: helix-turn-helix transcriptional regulator [Rhodobiaceae bacterium]|nr:helix-turn-helix transcriptional regulator [Rhodobiaceae bacterium]
MAKMQLQVNENIKIGTADADEYQNMFRDLLRQVVDEAGGNQTYATVKNISVATLNNWLRGVSEPKFSVAVSLLGEEKARMMLAQSQNAKNDIQEFALIPRHEISASAGPGLIPVEDGEVELLAFRRDWLSSMGVNPSNAVLVGATGDSMEPTVPDGALMLLDTSEKHLRNGWICAIVRGGELLVKRIQRRTDGTVILISDNEIYEPETIAEDRLNDLRVAGRVRWIGRAV